MITAKSDQMPQDQMEITAKSREWSLIAFALGRITSLLSPDTLVVTQFGESRARFRELRAKIKGHSASEYLDIALAKREVEMIFTALRELENARDVRDWEFRTVVGGSREEVRELRIRFEKLVAR